MRVLYVTTIGSTMKFFLPLIKRLINEGHIVDIASNENGGNTPVVEDFSKMGCRVHQISCSRAPIDIGNRKAVYDIRKLVEDNNYDIVHCHTPIAAACTRLACRKVRKKGTKVIYTAHGFHFYVGAPLANWLIYYPVEKFCAHWTDALITINREDYKLAKRKLGIKTIEYVPGVGIDVKKFANDKTNKSAKRNELGIPVDAYVLLSVGELNVNKNHQIVVRALGNLRDKTIHYVIAGKGGQEKVLHELAKEIEVEDQLHLIGYRSDVSELYKMADVYVLPSIREGLNVSVMEAMSSGLPCIVSDIRGNRDMVDAYKGGYLVNPKKQDAFVKAIIAMREGGIEMGQYNSQKSSKYDSSTINTKMMKIYEMICNR